MTETEQLIHLTRWCDDKVLCGADQPRARWRDAERVSPEDWIDCPECVRLESSPQEEYCPSCSGMSWWRRYAVVYPRAILRDVTVWLYAR